MRGTVDIYKRARINKICIMRESGYSFNEIAKYFGLSNSRIYQLFKKGQRITRNIFETSTPFDEPDFKSSKSENLTPREFYEKEVKLKIEQGEMRRQILLKRVDYAIKKINHAK